MTCRSEEHTSELQSRLHLVCRLLLEKKKQNDNDGTQAPAHARVRRETPPARCVASAARASGEPLVAHRRSIATPARSSRCGCSRGGEHAAAGPPRPFSR